ncbi:MAG: NAD(P)/FAD-dependent oxidoreductase [Thermodesulfobacteriota bacterium]
MRDDVLSKAAVLQRDGESYAIMAPLPGGVLDLTTARKVVETGEKFRVKTLKVTGAQRLALIGIKEEDLDAAYDSLGVKPAAGAHLCGQYIKVCPGNTFCTRGQRDALAFARRLHDRFYPFPKITSKVKIGVAGCFNSCVEPAIKDIGLIGLKKGWILMVGGAGGKEPMLGQVIAKDLEDDHVLEVIEKLLKFYRALSQRPQTRNLRLGVIMRKQGADRMRQVCGLG